MTEIRLFRKNQFGIGTWRIWSHPADPSLLLYAHAVTEGGTEVLHTDRVERNNSGRSLEAQVELEMMSRVSRQLDKGYKYSVDEAQLGSTNQLGTLNPMLAQALAKGTRLTLDKGDSYVQPKLDGHRCLITRKNGEVFAYSRKGKPIESIPHILLDLDWLPENVTLDGELYIHGHKLQALSSLIKRTQPASAQLRYHWYDFVHEQPFCKRFTQMAFSYKTNSMKHVDLVETTLVTSMAEVYELFRKYRALGYEGAMLRLSELGYQCSVRSSNLLKVKERHDCEVTVLGATPSKEGWAILRVKTDWGVEFDISAPGSIPEKTEVMENIENYINRRLTIEYAHLTDEQVPFHAVAIRWHEEV